MKRTRFKVLGLIIFCFFSINLIFGQTSEASTKQSLKNPLSDLTIYPLPAENLLTINGLTEDAVRISILNIKGQALVNQKLSGRARQSFYVEFFSGMGMQM